MFDLTKIESPAFLKDLSIKEMKILCEEIREFLITNISQTGGHLASNLGVVELTVAMHYVFDNEDDKFIFDVGHQSYVHKILTGRAKDFNTLRQFGGISGYISRKESKYDVWESGHSSNSVSAMSGFLVAKESGAKINDVVGIIGDASIANGMAFEGLNYLGSNKKQAPIIILNDNKMSISKSVGSLSRVFIGLRGTKIWRLLKRILNIIFPTFITNFFHQLKRGLKGFLQADNIFEDLGFDYFGPIDGNDLKLCITLFKKAKKMRTPCIIHLLTKKGLGYQYAESDDVGNFHGVSPFDIKTGIKKKVDSPNVLTFSEIVSEILYKKREEEKFKIICPAMMLGMNLKKFSEKYKNDFIDVGIAEEHAATMAAGIAINNQNVVLIMYSTFSQRAYDQILHDICRQNLKVIIGIDRAGIVGEDGQTHQGVYDIAMFNTMPNLVVAMPKNAYECSMLFNYAFKQNSPIVIRYPRLKEVLDDNYITKEICPFSWEIILEGKKGIIITYGPDVLRLEKIIKDNNFDVTLVNARFIKPVDTYTLKQLFDSKLDILVYEQVISNSLLPNIFDFMVKNNYFNVNIKSIGIDVDQIIEHGAIKEVMDHYNLGDEDIINHIKKMIE